MRTPSASSSPRIAGLALPFAVVGFAAGWLSDGVLANPLVDVIPHNNQLVAAVVAAAVGALLGAVLARKAASQQDLGATPLTAPQLTVLVIAGGVVAGGLVGGLEMGTSWGVLSGAFNGGLCSAAFIPVCALVFGAARRAERARHGSIVAGADRRAVWSILATALSVTTLVAALDVPFFRGHLAAPAGALMAAACALLLAGTFVADAQALRRVARIAHADLQEADPDEARFAEGIPAIDLGLGDDVRARVGRTASAYRSRARATALLLGSVGAARSALVRALARGALGLVVAGAVLEAHRWAGTPAALVAFEEQRCEHQWTGCYQAGLMLLQHDPPEAACPAVMVLSPEERAAMPRDVTRAERVLLRGCVAGDRCSCEALAASARGRGAEREIPWPYWYTGR